MKSHAGEDIGDKPVTTVGKSSPDAITSLLSPRESEVFQMLIAGKSDRDMASRMGISFWTVRGHIQQVFHKTGAINRRKLMARFLQPSRLK